jgi:hypothetical protein
MANNGSFLDDILARLNKTSEKTAEEILAESLAETNDEQTKVANDQTETQVKTSNQDADLEKEAAERAELEKVAALYDAQGRIMARAFYDELQKLASNN